MTIVIKMYASIIIEQLIDFNRVFIVAISHTSIIIIFAQFKHDYVFFLIKNWTHHTLRWTFNFHENVFSYKIHRIVDSQHDDPVYKPTIILRNTTFPICP